MPTNTLDVHDLVTPEQEAMEIGRKFDEWKSAQGPWEEMVKEIRHYVYATDTSTTENKKLPFMNNTSIPKIAQIKMNLQANYMSHLFPGDQWINWEAHDRQPDLATKKRVIESYVKTKTRQQDIESVFSDLLEDWIIYGNCFAELIYCNEVIDHGQDGEIEGSTVKYVGPRLRRISPHDIAFNVAANDFRTGPKIIRYLKSMGDLAKDAATKPELGYTQELLDRIRSNRDIVSRNHKRISREDNHKSSGLVADGFADLMTYYNQDLVEVLEYRGDYWDDLKGELIQNALITVVDRIAIVRKGPAPSWTGSQYIYHSAWGSRPDNLMGHGPLDNLLGMQYKIDKLENLRADIFDHIAYPVTLETGTVEFYGERGAPGGRYVADENGGVQFIRPDATALNADLQIAQTMQLMEEMAGSPKESMGFRTPGEKTKFEVQLLDNAANRIFRNKVERFERVVEEILNDFIEMARRNLDGFDVIRSLDPQLGLQQFIEVTKEDLAGSGKLYAVGSKHIINQANLLQEFTQLLSTPAGQVINPHVSRIGLARMFEEILQVEPYTLVRENVGIIEDVESQSIAQTGQAQLQEEAAAAGQVPIEEEPTE